MKLSATLLAVALSAVLALTARANDQPCGAGCGLQTKACLQTARTGMLSCKMDCRTNSDPNGLGTCLRGCKDTFRSGKTQCRSDLQVCIGSCAPSPNGCAGDCEQGLATCAQGVVSQAKTCLQAYRTVSDRLSCLQGCASQAQQGAAGCANDFASCLTACGVTPPPIPCLLSAPACGGGCPDGLSCQAASPGVPVACLCRPSSSPSGAFLD